MIVPKRARSEAQKEARRAAILATAAALFGMLPYYDITMAEVARRAGLAKGTLYLYFATKEELFLALQAELLWQWFDDVDGALAQLASTDVAVIASIFAAPLRRRPELARLLAILQSVLEQNVALAAALDFKRRLRERVLATGALLEARVGWLDPGAGALLLLRIHALVIGLHHMAEPAPVTRQVLAEPGMAIFAVDFDQAFEHMLRDLLRGMQTKQEIQP